MKQQRRYKEPQDTLWGKFLSGFMAVVFAMSTLTLIPIASAINGEPNEAQIQQQEELADQTSGKDEKTVELVADEQKLEPVELLSIASVEDEDDADDAAPADVTLKVKAQNATVTYNGNDVATELVVPADKDVKFTVKAADGFTLGAAAVKLADAKGETMLTPNAGEYTVAADRVADGATIVVTAEAVAGSANTDAAEPSTPAPSTELGEKANKVKSAISNFIEKLGGATTFAAAGNGNGNNSGSGTYATELPDITDWTLDQVKEFCGVQDVINVVMTSGDKFSNHGGENSKPDHRFLSTNDKVSFVDGQNAQAEIKGVAGETTIVLHAYKGKNDNDWSYQIFVVTLSSDKNDNDALVYDANGGIGTTLATTGKVNEVIKVAANGFTREGYEFVGWNTKADGTGTAYAAGADYTLTDAEDKLYAQWKRADLTYTINYVDEQGNAIDTAKVVNDAVFGTVVTASSEAKDIDGYTYKSADRESITVGTDAEANVITLTYAKRADLTYTINYVDEQGNAIDTAKVVNDAVFGTVVTASSEAKDIDGYTYKSADRESITVGTDAEANVITLTYANAILSYTVEYYYDDTLGETDTAPAVFNSPVTVNPATSTTRNDVNYTLVNVTPADGITIGVNETANVIRVYYEKDTITDPNNDGNGENPGDGIPDKYQAVVNYESANDAQGTVNLAQKVVTFANNATSGTINIFDGVTPNPTAGFVFDSWTEGGNAVASNLTRVLQGNTVYTFTANWALDVIGTDPTDPGNNVPDGIADKYQLVVTYAAIAGTIDGPTRYVLNKYDAAGNLAEDGVAVLTAAQIPGATADDGYGNGVWNNEPLANMELTDDTAFVIAFTALPAAAVVVPPLAPVAAAAPAAAAAAAATILDDGVPLATIDDDENALAAFEEIHCWTHWLMIFGALVTIVYGLAVLYRRRHGIRDMDDFEGDITGGRKYDAAAERNPAAGNAFQAM